MSFKIQPQPPRKKKYVRCKKQSPFPVPIASLTGKASSCRNWYQFAGELCGKHVIVKHTGDIETIHHMGYFGRGLLSRGVEGVYRSLPTMHLPGETMDQPRRVKVMRRRMYLRHMRWKREQSTNKKKEDCSDNQSNLDLEFESDLEYFPEETYENHEAESSDHPANHDNKMDIEKTPEKGGEEDLSGALWEYSSSNQKAQFEFLNVKQANQNTSVESWDTMEADEDFWSTEVKKDEDSVQSSSDFWTTESTCDTSINHNDDSDNQTGNTGKIFDRVNENESALNEVVDRCHEEKKRSLSVNSEDMASLIPDKKQKTVEVSLTSSHSVNHFTDNDENCDDIDAGMNESISISETISCSETTDNGNNNELTDRANVRINTNTLETLDTKLPLHPYCDSNPNKKSNSENISHIHDKQDDSDDNDDESDEFASDADDEYLVIDDSDVDDATYVVPKKGVYSWQAVLKKDPLRFNEPLVLSLEEAFFLSYGLGCLTVTSGDLSIATTLQLENQSTSNFVLDLPTMWRQFCKLKTRFLPLYAAYHYLRAKGWVPRCGVLFACDFMLYKVGPPFYHASYSIIVKTVREGTYEEIPEYRSNPFNWTQLSGINRVNEHVAKTLLLCYVVLPEDWREIDADSPNCLSRIKVKLQFMNRFVSSQERDQNKLKVEEET